MSGRKHSESTKAKMRLAALGEKNHRWKGHGVQYHALHEWVRKNFGQPSTCEKCGTGNLFGRKIHWANVSGKYLRTASDWVRLCVKCHRKMDDKRGTATLSGKTSRIRKLPA